MDLAPVTILCTRRQYVVVGLVLCAFSALGLMLAVLSLWPEIDARGLLLSIPFLAICGYFCAKSWHRALFNVPRIQIADEGIDDQASLWRIGFIPWNEIAELEVSFSHVTVLPTERAQWIGRMGPIKATLCWLALKLTIERTVEWPAAILPTDVSFDALITHIVSRHEHVVVNDMRKDSP